MEYVSGRILTRDGFEEGYIGFENHKIVDKGVGTPPKKPICDGLIVPTFVNAHTHIGDSFAKEGIIESRGGSRGTAGRTCQKIP